MEHKKFQPANLSASTFLFSREAWQVSHQASLFLARPVFTQNRITAKIGLANFVADVI